jgi:hypothetical protein
MEQTPVPTTSGQPPSPKTQTVGILMLISGLLNLLVAIGGGLGFILSIVLACCSPVFLLPAVLGGFEIYYSTKLLSSSGEKIPFANVQIIAILEICTILVGNVISMILGIVNLVLLNEPETKASFL